MKILFALLVIISGFSSIAKATNLNGESVLAVCDLPKHLGTDFCDGYLSGIVDGSLFSVINVVRKTHGDGLTNSQAIAYIQGYLGACIPSENTSKQLKEIVIQYIKREPTRWHLHAATLSIEALQQAFPCR